MGGDVGWFKETISFKEQKEVKLMSTIVMFGFI
jgi:hypothetical protein